MSELKPLSRRQLEELFLIAKPELREQDGRYELDIQNTVTAIYEALPNTAQEIATLRAEVDRLECSEFDMTSKYVDQLLETGRMKIRAETAEAEVEKVNKDRQAIAELCNDQAIRLGNAEAEVLRLRDFITIEAEALDDAGFSVDGDRFRTALSNGTGQ